MGRAAASAASALRAGEKLGDLEAIGWAKHELGTLRIAGGDIEGAERTLHEAREIRERIGDRRGLAATNRNLQVLCERLREMLRKEELVRAKDRRPSGLRLLSVAALLALLFVAGVAVGAIAGDSNGPGDATANGGANANGTDSNVATGVNRGTSNGTNVRTDAFPLVVNFAGEGSGTVEGEGIVCESDCEKEFPAGETVTLVWHTGDDGSVFEGFSGDCEGELCTVEMTEARSVTATFGPVAERSRVIEEEELSDEDGPEVSSTPSEETSVPEETLK